MLGTSACLSCATHLKDIVVNTTCQKRVKALLALASYLPPAPCARESILYWSHPDMKPVEHCHEEGFSKTGQDENLSGCRYLMLLSPHLSPMRSCGSSAHRAPERGNRGLSCACKVVSRADSLLVLCGACGKASHGATGGMVPITGTHWFCSAVARSPRLGASAKLKREGTLDTQSSAVSTPTCAHTAPEIAVSHALLLYTFINGRSAPALSMKSKMPTPGKCPVKACKKINAATHSALLILVSRGGNQTPTSKQSAAQAK